MALILIRKIRRFNSGWWWGETFIWLLRETARHTSCGEKKTYKRCIFTLKKILS